MPLHAYFSIQGMTMINLKLKASSCWVLLLLAASLGLPFTTLPPYAKWLPPAFLAVMLLLVAPYRLFRHATEMHAAESMELWEKNAGLREQVNVAQRTLRNQAALPASGGMAADLFAIVTQFFRNLGG